MPSYIVTCRGAFVTAKGIKSAGDTVEMSEKDAASLPPGTVSLVPEKQLLLVAPPPVSPVPAAPVVPTGLKPTPSAGARRAKDSKP